MGTVAKFGSVCLETFRKTPETEKSPVIWLDFGPATPIKYDNPIEPNAHFKLQKLICLKTNTLPKSNGGD